MSHHSERDRILILCQDLRVTGLEILCLISIQVVEFKFSNIFFFLFWVGVGDDDNRKGFQARGAYIGVEEVVDSIQPCIKRDKLQKKKKE